MSRLAWLGRLALLPLAFTLMQACGGGGGGSTAPAPTAPTISTQPSSQTVLEGATATFSVTAAGTVPLSYQWKKGGTAITAATSASYTTPATTLADSGASFTVTITNSAGSVTSNAATLTVNPAPPSITTQPSNQTVLAGTDTSFTVVAAGSAPLSYQWRKGGANLPGRTSASLNLSTVSTSDAGSYDVVVTNAAGTVTSNAATLAVQVPVSISAHPASTTVTAPATATFSVTATGTPSPSYQWRRNGVDIVGAISASYTTPATALANNGDAYTVRVSNAVNTVTSNAATLTVYTLPAITGQPGGQVVVEGASATFIVTAVGNPTPTYQWRKDGVDILGATSASYTTPATTAGDDGSTFQVAVTNTVGTVTSNSVTLSIQVPIAITTHPLSQTVTAPAAATFSVVAAGSSPAYQWRRNDTDIPGATSSSYTTPATALANNGDTYSVRVYNGLGPVTSSNATLTVLALPSVITPPANATVRQGATATFSVVATGNPAPTYQWRKNSIPIGSATNASYTTPTVGTGDNGSTFDVVLTNSVGSVTSAAATLTVTPTFSVSGSVNLQNSSTGVQNVTLTLNTTPETTTTTDVTGSFQLTGVPAGTYTLTPSISGPSSAFYPPTRTVVVTTGDVPSQSFRAALGYQVSGTIAYSGSMSGRIYVELVSDNGGDNVPGTSLAAPGSYLVRGVRPGSYTLRAYRDPLGYGHRNALDPYGSTPVVVTNSNTTADVTMTDPTPVSLTGTTGPVDVSVNPIDQGAVIFWGTLNDGNDIEQAEAYVLEWSTAANFAGAQSATVPAHRDGVYFLNGLTNSTAYYFRVKGKAGITYSNTSTPVGPVTIGQPAGGSTLSGTVTLPASPTGTLYVGLFNPASGQVYGTRIASPMASQPYSVGGVPNGTYQIFGILDRNTNGVIDPGDFSNTNGGLMPTVVVAGNASGQNVTISGANMLGSLTTEHARAQGESWDWYSLQGRMTSNAKLPVKLTLTSGPNLPVPYDFLKNAWGEYQLRAELSELRPTVGSTYVIQATYADGTTEDLSYSIAAVLDSFAQNLAPATSGSGNTTPTFTWQAPAAPPASYGYSFWIGPANGGNLWDYPKDTLMPSTQTSLVYNTDGRAGQAALSIGLAYRWNLVVEDAAGNRAILSATYTP